MPTSTREKPPRFPFRAVGVDAYLGAKSRALRGCASKLACGRRIDPSHRPNGNAPARGGRTLLHWVSFSRRRGRCPHRPAESTRFMVLFRRIHVDFPFCTVGADDPVRPPEMPVFTEI